MSFGSLAAYYLTGSQNNRFQMPKYLCVAFVYYRIYIYYTMSISYSVRIISVIALGSVVNDV